jgi:hypothetical protein
MACQSATLQQQPNGTGGSEMANSEPLPDQPRAEESKY